MRSFFENGMTFSISFRLEEEVIFFVLSFIYVGNGLDLALFQKLLVLNHEQIVKIDQVEVFPPFLCKERQKQIGVN